MVAKIVAEVQAQGLLEPMVLATLTPGIIGDPRWIQGVPGWSQAGGHGDPSVIQDRSKGVSGWSQDRSQGDPSVIQDGSKGVPGWSQDASQGRSIIDPGGIQGGARLVPRWVPG